MEYTKGEWKARHPINNDYTIYAGEYGKGIVHIATLFESSPNAEANARLIAAAPDMCKALKAYVEVERKMKIKRVALLEQAEQALLKAEGI